MDGGGLADARVPNDSGSSPDRVETEIPARVEMELGPSGGRIALEDGTRVDLPTGALSVGVVISIERVGSGRYRFGPAGTSFLRPVTISLPTPPGLGAEGAINFSRPDTVTEFDELPTRYDPSRNTSSAQVTHFSEAFIRAGGLLAEFGVQTLALTMGRSDSFGCVVLDDGSLRCFGYSPFGLRGARSPWRTGGTNLLDLGEPVATVTSSRSLVACAVTLSGALYCWGQDDPFEPFPDADCASELTSRPTRLLENVRDVALGARHGCVAYRSTGEVACFGDNTRGEAGIGTEPSRAFPCGVPTLQPIPGLRDIVQVVAGGRTTCARQLDGDVYCWGSTEHLWPPGTQDVCMRAEPLSCQATPRLVEGVQATHVSIGADGICMVLMSGQVRCAKDATWSDLPVRDTTYLSSAGGTTCAVVRAGEIECWGEGEGGELGDDSFTNSATPRTVLGITDAIQVSVGANIGATTVCATTRSRGLFCWGNGLRGGLGYDRQGTTAGYPVAITW